MTTINTAKITETTASLRAKLAAAEALEGSVKAVTDIITKRKPESGLKTLVSFDGENRPTIRQRVLDPSESAKKIAADIAASEMEKSVDYEYFLNDVGELVINIKSAQNAIRYNLKDSGGAIVKENVTRQTAFREAYRAAGKELSSWKLDALTSETGCTIESHVMDVAEDKAAIAT